MPVSEWNVPQRRNQRDKAQQYGALFDFDSPMMRIKSTKVIPSNAADKNVKKNLWGKMTISKNDTIYLTAAYLVGGN